MLTIQSFTRNLLAALALVISAGAAVAGPAYHVDINTSADAGSVGFLDLYLSRDLGAPPSTVTLRNFNGTLGGGATVTGDVSGNLPGTVVFGSTDGWNDLFQSVVFGGMFSFDLEFGGDFATTSSDITSLFGIGLWDDTGLAYLGAGDALQFGLVPLSAGVDGGVTVRMFNETAHATELPATAVPEPSDWALMLSGLGMLGFMTRRRNNTAAR